MPSKAVPTRENRTANQKDKTIRSEQTTVPQGAGGQLHLDPMGAADVLALQKAGGNQAVARLLGLQPRLSVGPADDPFEREAEQIAEQVIRQPNAQPQAANGPADAPIRRQDDEEELQAKPAETVTALGLRAPTRPNDLSGAFNASAEIENEIHATRGAGQPLPSDLREDMEARFGADFEAVRLHTDHQAGEISRKLQAQAFTIDEHIYMGEGRFEPGSSEGRRLLAHELTHTIQQSGGARRRGFGVRRQVIQRGFLDWFRSKPKPGGGTPTPTVTPQTTPPPTETTEPTTTPPTTPVTTTAPLVPETTTPPPTTTPPTTPPPVVATPEEIAASLQRVRDALTAWEAAQDNMDLSARSSALAAVKAAINAHATLDPSNTEMAGKLSDVRLQEQRLEIMQRIKDKYGITLQQEAGVNAVKAAYTDVTESVRNSLKPVAWTLDELNDVESALSRYAGLLGAERIKKKLGDQSVTTFSRLKQGIDEDTASGALDDTTAGETFDSNITMFDAGTSVLDFVGDKSNPTPDELRKGFRGTIEHELSHALIEDVKVKGNTKAIQKFVADIAFWKGSRYSSKYWRPKGTDYGEDGFDNDETREAAKKAKVEAPITNYGMKNANEDLAEALMFFFEDAGKLESTCPKRFAFITKYIAPLLQPAPDKAKKGK